MIWVITAKVRIHNGQLVTASIRLERRDWHHAASRGI